MASRSSPFSTLPEPSNAITSLSKFPITASIDEILARTTRVEVDNEGYLHLEQYPRTENFEVICRAFHDPQSTAVQRLANELSTHNDQVFSLNLNGLRLDEEK